MPISQTDIKLLESERLTDADEGGGRMTGRVIIDGEENNIFPDISTIDRAYGRASLRKAFMAVQTDDTDVYFGANLIIDKQPEDPNVAVSLFTTNSPNDLRSAARDYLERFVAEGPLSEMKLLGTHFSGQRLVLAFQRVGARLPEVGEVYVLSEESGTVVSGFQFVRVLRVEHEQVEYVDSSGVFLATQINLEISVPLERTFPGGEPNRYSNYQPPTKIRKVTPVDAVHFYSTRPLTHQAQIGDYAVRVDSIFTPLIPAAQGQTSFVDVQAGGLSTVTISAGARNVEIPQVSHTGRWPVTIQNRGFNYTGIAKPLPAAGTFTLSYRAQGRWYTVNDNGTGQLVGDGSGAINFVTGSWSVTLAALPDIDSALLWAYGSPVHYVARSAADVTLPEWHYTAQHGGIEPGSAVLSWESGSGLVSAAFGTDGAYSGALGVGRMEHVTGELWFRPALLPSPGTTPVLEYEYGAMQTETFTPSADGNGFITLNPSEAVTPGSLVLEWDTVRTKTASEKSAR